MLSLSRLTAIALCLAGRVTISGAQTTYPSPTASSSKTTTSQTSAQTHSVQAGKGGFKFSPEVIQANPGDTVQFLFYPSNHSVVRSDYKYPCLPYEDVGWNRTGFFSGFHFLENTTSAQPTFSVLVNDTKPIWFYCSAPNACIEYLMIGVINPGYTQTLEVQKLYAANSSYMLQPNEPFPAEASSAMASLTIAPLSSQSPTSTPPPLASSSSSSSPSAIPRPDSHGGLGAGPIAGIAIGAAAVVFLIACLFFFMGQSRSYKHVLQRQNKTTTPSSPGSSNAPDMLEYGNPSLSQPTTHSRPLHSQDGPPRYGRAPTSDVHEAPSPNLNSPREVFSPHPFAERSPAATDE
jgi:plastocyanin